MKQKIGSAPSNIALIKYMGKIEGSGNKPANASLSYSLEHLRTFVRITEKPDLKEDQWQALKGKFEGWEMEPIELSDKGRTKFLKHFAMLKERANMKANFLIESANNFPSDCGLASSASSFAALTLVAADILDLKLSIQELSVLSRQGSGSSCRSLYSPWALWREEAAEKLESPYVSLLHQVVIVESGKKEVSSSEAHLRVTTSELFKGRVFRAEKRLMHSLEWMLTKNWKSCFELFWAEFWDMHALFQTSQPPFGYMTEGSLEVLNKIESYWKKHQDGPWVTMDAGANVHLLYRPDQKSAFDEISREISPKYRILQSSHGAQ